MPSGRSTYHRTTEDSQRTKSSRKGSTPAPKNTIPTTEGKHRRSTLDEPPVVKANPRLSKTTSSEPKAQSTKTHSRTARTATVNSRNNPSFVRRHVSNDIQLSILNPMPRGSPDRRIEIPIINPVVRQAPEKVIRNVPPNDQRQKSGGFLSLIFGAPNASPEQRITCLICMSDDIPMGKSAKLACSHQMCHACLKRIFLMSLTDPQHMPPKCCTSDHIPLKHVEKLFDTKFKVKWNRKYQEYKTKNRIYCPTKNCGVWIKPSQIFIDTSAGSNGGRKYGKCARCKTKVCCTCNSKWHLDKECPKDENVQSFVAMAREMGWKRCHSCSAMVELKEGCNHMTCRCTAEFCMVCGSKWKTCDCPWFNYNTGAEDQLNFMNVPGENVAPDRGQRERAVRYQAELRQRRAQEQHDEDLARRLQWFGMDYYHDGPPIPGLADPHGFDFGNAMGQFLNESYNPYETDASNSRNRRRGSVAAARTGRNRVNTPSPPPERVCQRSHRNRH